MQRLPKDFFVSRYGLNVRLVNDDDANFIVSLRSDPTRTKFMVTLEADVNKQKEWIIDYKTREREGVDYYFVFCDRNNVRIGVYRISQINYEKKICKSASWIAIEGLDYEAIKMLIIKNEIAFNVLNLDISWGEVHKDNIKVFRILKLFGYKIGSKQNDFYHVSIKKEDFFMACQRNDVKKIIWL